MEITQSTSLIHEPQLQESTLSPSQSHNVPTIKVSQVDRQDHIDEITNIHKEQENLETLENFHVDTTLEVPQEQSEKKTELTNSEIYSGNQNEEIEIKDQNQEEKQIQNNFLNPERSQTEYFSSIYSNNEKPKEVILEVKEKQESDLFMTCRESWKESKIPEEDPKKGEMSEEHQNENQEKEEFSIKEKGNSALIDRKNKKEIRSSIGGEKKSESVYREEMKTCNCLIM